MIAQTTLGYLENLFVGGTSMRLGSGYCARVTVRAFIGSGFIFQDAGGWVWLYEYLYYTDSFGCCYCCGYTMIVFYSFQLGKYLYCLGPNPGL